MNPSGEIVGVFTDDQSNKTHGFLRTSDDYLPIDFPGATATRAFGINARGDVVGTFIDSAGEDTLGRIVDMSFVGLGQLPLPIMFSIFVTGHLNNLCGEISALKGTVGLKGYPF